MAKSKPLIASLIIFNLGFSNSGCEQKPRKLLLGASPSFIATSSPEEIAAISSLPPLTDDHERAESIPIGDLRGKYSVEAKRVNFKSLNTSGSLIFEFFNKQLYQVQFIPDEPDLYSLRLQQYMRRPVTSATEAMKGVSLSVSAISTTQSAFIWTHDKLADEMEEWLRIHSEVLEKEGRKKRDV